MPNAAASTKTHGLSASRVARSPKTRTRAQRGLPGADQKTTLAVAASDRDASDRVEDAAQEVLGALMLRRRDDLLRRAMLDDQAMVNEEPLIGG